MQGDHAALIKRRFGWTSAEVPVIGQGTWMIEGSGGIKRKEAIEAIKKGVDLGLSHIDTAEMYGNGMTEEVVAEAIGERRNDVFLASKVLPSNASYDGTLEACKQSLKRLKTDWLDLYLLHWPSTQYPIRDTMRAMEKLVKEGLVRFIGVSNFELDELKEAENALSDQRLACNQVLYHLKYRGIERQIIPYCIKQGIAVVGYSPYGHGNFPSIIKSKGGKVLDDIAKRHGHTARQVALNFLTRNPGTFTIPKSSSAEHVKENSGGSGWNLSDDEIAAIDRAFPIQDGPLEMI